MHYHEDLADGTVLGLYDGSTSGGAISETDYYRFHEEVARREHPRTRGHRFPEANAEYPLRALQHARVRTALISTYRIHKREYLHFGPEFPRTWEATPAKIAAAQRFSPPGTVGYYYGLSLDGAIDEASHYAGHDVEQRPDPSSVILVHRTYYTDLLYLAPVLPALWEYLDLPEMPTTQMYLTIMSPDTSSECADQIGTWARSAGYKGIIYPSARYGQRMTVRGGSADRFPLMSFVDVGSHLCEQGVAIQFTMSALVEGLTRKPPVEPPTVVYSEPNLVVFDEAMVAGLDRPVFYATYNSDECGVLRSRDEREGSKHWMMYGYEEDEITLFVEGPDWYFHLSAPR